jgi:hypothetical protein
VHEEGGQVSEFIQVEYELTITGEACGGGITAFQTQAQLRLENSFLNMALLRVSCFSRA